MAVWETSLIKLSLTFYLSFSLQHTQANTHTHTLFICDLSHITHSYTLRYSSHNTAHFLPSIPLTHTLSLFPSLSLILSLFLFLFSKHTHAHTISLNRLQSRLFQTVIAHSAKKPHQTGSLTFTQMRFLDQPKRRGRFTRQQQKVHRQ